VIVCAIVLSKSRTVDPLNQFNMVDSSKHRHVNW
jgi:hypothetical protein